MGALAAATIPVSLSLTVALPLTRDGIDSEARFQTCRRVSVHSSLGDELAYVADT